MDTLRHRFSKWRRRGALWVPMIFAVLCACSRSTPAPKSDEFFATWLQAHGETNIVVDADGVGIA